MTPTDHAPAAAGNEGDAKTAEQQSPRRTTYADVFAVREFRALFASDTVSLAGDQIATVALVVLLYDRSGSALLAALGYSAAYLPWAVGGPLLSTLADRLPTRAVLVSCDVLRAALFALAAIPGLPVAAVALLVLVAGLAAPAFDSAASTLYVAVLDGERYPVGVGVRAILHQSTQLGGFLVGGALLLVLDPHQALALDAATFVVSALVLRYGLHPRPAATDRPPGRPHLLADALEGLQVVASDVRRWGPLALGVAGASYAIAAEAVAPAYSLALGGSAALVGMIMASVAAGSIAGSVVLGRLVPARLRDGLMWPLALSGTVPLMLLSLRPATPLALALLTLAGFGTAFQVPANTAFARAIPPQVRGRAFGLAMTCMFGGQGVAVLATGAAAQVFSAPTVIAGSGALGALTVSALWFATTRRTVQ